MIALLHLLLMTSAQAQTTGDVRLVNGLISSAGRVEYYQNGQWGTICDDRWYINACHAVCRQVGYTGAYQAVRYAIFGEGTGPIQLSNVECQSNAANLANCNTTILPTNCGHSEDAACVCCPTVGTACIPASSGYYGYGCDATCRAALPANLQPPTFPTGATKCNFYSSYSFGSSSGVYPQPTNVCDYNSKYTCNADSTYTYESWSSSSQTCSGTASSRNPARTSELGRCGGIDCYASEEEYRGTANCDNTPRSQSARYTGGECMGQERDSCDNTYYYSFSYTGSGFSCAASEESSWSRTRINTCIGAANSSYKYTGCTNPTAVQGFTNAMGGRITQYSGAGCSGSVDLQSEVRTGHCYSGSAWYCSSNRMWNYRWEGRGVCSGNLASVAYFPTGCSNTTIFGTSGANGAKKWQAECLPTATAAPTLDFGAKSVMNAAYFYDGTCNIPIYGFFDVVNECDYGAKYECGSGGSARVVLYGMCDCSGPVNNTVTLTATCTLVPEHRCVSSTSSSTTIGERWLSVLSCGTVVSLNPADAPGPIGTLSGGFRAGFGGIVVLLMAMLGVSVL